MNVGAWCEKHRQFPLHKVSNIRSHSYATTNRHLRCSKEGKWDTKEDKDKSMMHAHCRCCGWQKGTSKAEAASNGEKASP